jgi:hypothetical protein
MKVICILEVVTLSLMRRKHLNGLNPDSTQSLTQEVDHTMEMASRKRYLSGITKESGSSKDQVHS